MPALCGGAIATSAAGHGWAFHCSFALILKNILDSSIAVFVQIASDIHHWEVGVTGDHTPVGRLVQNSTRYTRFVRLPCHWSTASPSLESIPVIATSIVGIARPLPSLYRDSISSSESDRDQMAISSMLPSREKSRPSAALRRPMSSGAVLIDPFALATVAIDTLL
jgi:hypothetical protein